MEGDGINRKNISKLVALNLVCTSIAMGGDIKAFASTKDKNDSITLNVKDETIKMDIDKIDEENVKINTVTNNGGVH